MEGLFVMAGGGGAFQCVIGGGGGRGFASGGLATEICNILGARLRGGIGCYRRNGEICNVWGRGG